jgi:uncharacterized coiled-coil protein SlyX
MLLAQSLTWIEWGLLGTVLVCTAIVLSRAFQSAGKAGQTDEEHEHVESTAARRLANLEVRLYDYAREVEAGLEKRVVELNTLVAAADKEIMRLTDLLKDSAARKELPASQVGRTPPTDVSGAQQQMIFHLHDAGYSVPEIAHMVGRPPEAVDSVLRAA